LLSACDRNEYTFSEVELIVASEMATAVDVGSGEERPFMQVKEAGRDSEYWVLIYGINGFEYESGYEYILKVEKKVPKEPIMYLPPVEYTLKKIISKIKK
jgi:hypothetical protein